MTDEPLRQLDAIAQTIFDKKGFNIIALDIRGVSSLTDFVVIAEGNVDRHILSLSSSITDVLQEKGVRPLHVEGLQVGDWVVLDYGDIMIHLFTSELRDKYRLEELWRGSKLVNVNIKMDSTHGK